MRSAVKLNARVVSPKTVSMWHQPRLRAFLDCRLGLELFALPQNDPVIRIGSSYFVNADFGVVIARPERPWQSPAFEPFEIAASAFGLLLRK